MWHVAVTNTLFKHVLVELLRIEHAPVQDGSDQQFPGDRPRHRAAGSRRHRNEKAEGVLGAVYML